MDAIVLRVSELTKPVGKLVRARMDDVPVMLPEGDPGESLLPSATFAGVRSVRPFELVDLNALEGVADTEVSFDLMSVSWHHACQSGHQRCSRVHGQFLKRYQVMGFAHLLHNSRMSEASHLLCEQQISA
ncbi:MAG: hypothetical protein VB041_06390 [Candidatus Limiplasma sp.]|nr:hypothetical protein [Candidatus Limiplasma sp.]